MPSVLSYDMQNGENCCKRADIPVPEGYQAVEDDVLRLWSGRILENWNLYKKALGSGKPLSPDASPPAALGEQARYKKGEDLKKFIYHSLLPYI